MEIYSNIISPITGKKNVEILETFQCEEIIDLYKSKLNYDVKEYFLNVKEVLICICLDTGYRFYYPFNTAGDSKFYENLQDKLSYFHKWNWQNKRAIKYIKEGDKLLEIGAGDGNFLERITRLDY